MSQQNEVAEKGGMPVVAEPSSIMQAIIKAASDPSTDIAKVESMMALYERLEAKRAETAFNDAMSAAQTEMRPVVADKDNSQTKSKYASYGALDKAVRPIYTDHGFSISFDNGDAPAPDVVRVLCYVAHRDGFSRTYKVDMPADGKGAKGGDVMTRTHAAGSANTYGMRNLLKMIFNIAIGDPWDDDGNGAGDTGEMIGDEEIEKVFDLIKRSNSDTAKFCKYLGYASVPDIRKRDVGRAFEALNSALEAKQKKQ